MNIFVAKLSYNTTDDDLRKAFEAFGTVSSSRVIIDRETGNSKGFGFVEMPNNSEALNAIQDLNDSELGGRKIVVKKAKPKTGNNSRDRRPGGDMEE